ncbi:hypothetical protein L3Q82_015467 [Scortum barcoo]|uniref:Uncharacterized protein n=1 Tax=Scortum barcoo TaxID=214431 RepID=A0ACB8VN88_9TELE|nr:hypothetical protein L3Q82_015467 [Scortum barcoo]
MFSASIVDAAVRFEVVDARSLVPVVAATPNPVVDTVELTGTWQAKLKPSKPAARTVLEAKTSGLGGVRGEAMEEDYRSASKRFWQTVRRLRRGKQYSANTVYLQ